MTITKFEPNLPQTLIDGAVAQALSEDLGLAGDITTNATVAKTTTTQAVIRARQSGIISGHDVAATAFTALDPEITYEPNVADGDVAQVNATIATISGNARAILTAERVALNFLGRMSGIATHTRTFVDAVAGTKTAIVDTRKTTPGLRAFEKYAVRCGGGMNHRVGLFDAVLIKDNHIAAAGSLSNAIEAARTHAGHMVKIEVEVDTLEQLQEVLQYEVDAVLLDNMSTDELRQAVATIDGRLIAEASGGVTLDTVRAIAQTGVDLISIGALTHSSPVLDLGLDF